VVLVLQALVFASAAAGLVATGHRSLAVVFGVIVVINAILIYVWGQYHGALWEAYSPECMEGVFLEVPLRSLPGVEQ
jgi:hypothetical protein